MKKRSFPLRLLASISKIFQKRLFDYLSIYCRGDVLDVGGRDFFTRIQNKNIQYESWISLEYEKTAAFDRLDTVDKSDGKHQILYGDGCNLEFEDETFDTVLNIQVLEHVFEPIKMMSEISRVLKPNGTAIIFAPQTMDLHMAPYHFQNFTRYWFLEAAKNENLEIVELVPFGGVWRTLASRFFLGIVHGLRVPGWTVPEIKRPLLFYPLFPFMILYAMINIPFCLLFSLADIKEEANNHLVVLRKSSS